MSRDSRTSARRGRRLRRGLGRFAGPAPRQNAGRGGYRGKRLFDLAVAVPLLALLALPMLLIAAAVRLSSRGPALFRQRRLSLRERPFTILKFRTMRVDAPRQGPAFTQEGDPRITPLGRLLRKSSLDELPQLLNVVAGQMSLVGPRPYIGFELDRAPRLQRAERASVLPGLTGLAQVGGRSALTSEEALALDLQYARQCGFALDCRIGFRTVRAILGRRGTN